jgi:hypothetical protein
MILQVREERSQEMRIPEVIQEEEGSLKRPKSHKAQKRKNLFPDLKDRGYKDNVGIGKTDQGRFGLGSRFECLDGSNHCRVLALRNI